MKVDVYPVSYTHLVQGGDAGGAGTDLAGWVYTATSGDVSGLWAHYYGIINQANRCLLYTSRPVRPASPSLSWLSTT